VKSKHDNWRVARRDEHVDGAVIDALQQRLEPWRPGPAVIERAPAEQGDQADAIAANKSKPWLKR